MYLNNSEIGEDKMTTKLDFDKTFGFIISKEGGYVNHPKDSGKATKYGVTDATYREFRESMGMPTQSVLHIEMEEVAKIFKYNYWIPAGCDKLDDGKYACVLADLCYNSGVSRSKKYHSIAKGNIETLFKLREEFYNKIVKNNPSQKVFLKGWMNRIADLRKYIAAWDLITF